MTSPTQRTLAKLRKDGYMAGVVERWNPHARIRQDFLGVIDVIGLGHGETVAVQACSYSSVSKRVQKIEDSDALPYMRDAEWRVLVWGWRKVGSRWKCREVDMS